MTEPAAIREVVAIFGSREALENAIATIAATGGWTNGVLHPLAVAYEPDMPRPVDHLDHASYQQFWGGKAGVDATRKLPTEGYTRGWPDEMTMSPEVTALVDKRWKEYGI